MTDDSNATEDIDASAEIQRIVESAQRLGVELDEEATLQWLTAIAAAQSDDDPLQIDVENGIFGHKVSMLDFSPHDLARFRRIGAVVEVTGPEGIVEGALALSGSAAQSKIQSFPGDADFFQRLNIVAPTRAEASDILAEVLREKVLATLQGPTYQFLEAKLGTHVTDGTVRGSLVRKGSPISWSAPEIAAGEMLVERPDGSTVAIQFRDAAHDPGWCKLDWVVADPERHQLSNASNVIDVTWEGPDGEIIALDGYLDAYFQEVYLDADALPVFAKVASFVSDDALDDYVEKLEGEVRKYLTKNVNYGKAAKRMYNVFRLSGRHMDAAFVRELFDEPATILYQVWSLITTLQNATVPGSSIPIEEVQAQADSLVLDVITALEGDEEVEIVAALLALRRTLDDQEAGEAKTAAVEAAQGQVVNLINTFFQERLMDMPTIKEYIDGMQAEHTQS